jgi:DNA sulfur modification protein DndC
MSSPVIPSKISAFDDIGFKSSIEGLVSQIKDMYAADEIPWIIGYSGGKDSTAVTQLVWTALSELKPSDRTKTVHIITTDTLVENPIVSGWVNKSLVEMAKIASEQSLPIDVHALVPEVHDRFWVNLLGKGYPSPRHKFRWCTERMKIKPVDKFVNDVVKSDGEAILVLGTRKAESTVRATRMKEFEKNRKRNRLSSHKTLQNSYIYSPIENWTNDDVWTYLMQVTNNWGYDNENLLNMYRGATEDNECPLVVDTTTPSCGSSRFGCWVCTMVDEDKSMTAMIKNNDERAWMGPLLDFRNTLKEHDHEKRDFRRMRGNVQLFDHQEEGEKVKTIPGPYTQKTREKWVRQLLCEQKKIQSNEAMKAQVGNIDLITIDELHEIRRIWVIEKHEIEDSLPQIYEEEMGVPFPMIQLDDRQPFGSEEIKILKDLCDDDLQFELIRELLDLERGYRNSSKRSNLFKKIEQVFKKNFYEDVEDAIERAQREKNLKSAANNLLPANPEITEVIENFSNQEPPKKQMANQ